MVAMNQESAVNQLQFNLSAPPLAANLATSGHYRLQPQPIVIEKIGSRFQGSAASFIPGLPPASLDISHQSLNLSAVSEQRLSLAVQLVKRDLKKKHEEEQLNALHKEPDVPTKQPSYTVSRNRSKTSQSRPYKQLSGAKQTTSISSVQNKNSIRGKKLTQRGRSIQHVPPQNTKPSARHGESGSPARPWVSGSPTRPQESGSPARPLQTHLPATTNSPPTRDNDKYAHPTRSKDEQLTFDLQRLQRELSEQLDKICDILSTLVTRIENISDDNKDEQSETSDEESRRKFRLNEQASRSARTLYHLQQQVRDIELEYGHLGTSTMGRARKTQALSRLAAAHRGALRSLYTLTTHLQSMTIGDSPPDLSIVSHVHQDLVMLCSQLDVETNVALQESLVKKVNQAQEMVYVWRIHYQSAVHMTEKQTDDLKKRKPHTSVKKQQKAHTAKGVSRRPGFIVGFQRWPSKPVRQKHSILKKTCAANYPDRSTRLRAGIQSLMYNGSDTPEGHQEIQTKGGVIRKSQAAAQDTETPNGHHETQLRGAGFGKTRSVAWDIPNAGSVPSQRGVLLPQAVQERRIMPQFNGSDVTLDGHYSDLTIAASLKSVQKADSRASSAPPSPSSNEKPKGSSQVPWIPAGSPSRTSSVRRCRSHSPSGKLTMESNNNSKETDTLDDVIIELFPEKYGDRKSRSRTRVQFAAESPGQPCTSSPRIYKTDARSSAAQLRQSCVSPSLSDSSQIGEREQYMEELILNDVLTDTADELNRLEMERGAEEHAKHMMNMPSFETMKQRLEEMEREQDEIRQRWKSVCLVDVSKTRILNHDASPQEVHSPASIEIQPSVSASSSCRLTQDEYSDSPSEAAPLLFTKQSSLFTTVIQREKLPVKYSVTTSARANHHDIQPVTLILPPRLVDSVLQNVQEYNSFLKRNQQHGGGGFEPWKLVEEISDELLDTCLMEVAAELEEFNSDLINHVCKSEFAVMETSTDTAATVENIQT